MEAAIAAFVGRTWSVPDPATHMAMQTLRGGLESKVVRVRVSLPAPHRRGQERFVVKELRTRATREAQVYDTLWRHLEHPPAVRVLGRAESTGATLLFLEDATPSNRWPWTDPRVAARVSEALARLHANLALRRLVPAWDYETELADSADATLRLAAKATGRDGRRLWRPLGDLRRVVGALPEVRARLRRREPAFVHGDVHPGNVLVRTSADNVAEILLIDWARARVGSPFEDLASWLHSLGCWEPEARRRHDTLMRAYFVAQGLEWPPRQELRSEYWLASASNGLSGAIRYHLTVLSDPASPSGRAADARRALAAWTRVVRRAAAVLRTSPAD